MALLPTNDIVRIDDAYVIDSLKRCGLNDGTVFHLMWGMRLLDEKLFPVELNQIVDALLNEDAEIEDITDREEKKIRRIIFDLDYLLTYQLTVERIVEAIKKIKKQKTRYGRRPYEI
jgi:hypothetical protein